MKLSTRARYGVRMMLDLARQHGQRPVYLREVAEREAISEKYLSQIIILLRGQGLVLSTRGASGGYSLARSPAEITLRDIVEPLEGGNCLVECVEHPSACSRVPTCAARDIWALLGEKISETLDSVTLEELVRRNREKSGNNLSHAI
ncbi:MAG: Rrf2 family transcriptional regulator [Desulfobacterales bacterium]|nr:Rrf2 family transcriptional regulator [Desulfobacterales bacterium]